MAVTQLVCLGGTGDAYLVAALAGAYQQRWDRDPVLIVKARQDAIPAMFGLRYVVEDELVQHAEQNRDLQRDYDNRPDGDLFYAHPCFRGGRLDDLTVCPGHASQADMYRSMLGLPLDAPLARPVIPVREQVERTAVFVPDAVSWPNNHPEFWQYRLTDTLVDAGWEVRWNDPGWSLGDLLSECAAAALVAGPQCGLMSILCAAEFPCRKAIVTPAIDDGPGFTVGKQTLRNTYPYAYVTRFSGNDYQVAELSVSLPRDYAEVCASVLRYAALPHDPRPVTTVMVPLTPGDLIDRLAVLSVKMDRFDEGRRALIEREYLRYRDLYYGADLGIDADELYARLREVHAASFDAIEAAVSSALDTDEVVRANRDRVGLRNQIDALCRAPYAEVKSYYGEG